MKRICLFILIVTAACKSVQNKEEIISMNGLGSLKLGMSQVEVEKLLNTAVIMTKNYLDTLNGYYEDTAKVTYKNIPLQLEFQRSYTAPNKFHMRLIGIRASSPLCKTASGITIGSDKLKIIADYDTSHIKIQQGYVSYYNTEEGKGKTTLSVMDDEVSLPDNSDLYTMVFYLLNKKVVSFELKAKLKEEQ